MLRHFAIQITNFMAYYSAYEKYLEAINKRLMELNSIDSEKGVHTPEEITTICFELASVYRCMGVEFFLDNGIIVVCEKGEDGDRGTEIFRILCYDIRPPKEGEKS